MTSITSTWDSMAANGDAGSLQQCIRKVSQEEAKDFEFDADSMIDFESCFQLTKPTDCVDQKCNLMLSSNEFNSHSRILIVSESKRVEVFDYSSGEYKFTKIGELVDGTDPDMMLFKIDVLLDKSTANNVRLQLTGTRDNFWLLKIFVFMSDTTKDSSMHLTAKTMGSSSRFNIEEMNEMLKSAELSDKAQNFKGLFETFQKSQSVLPPFNPSLMGSLINSITNESKESGFTSSTSSTPNEKHKGDANGDILPGLDKFYPPQRLDSARTFPNNSGDCTCDKKCCVEQNQKIESSMKELEDRILTKLTEIEAKQEQKLNRIIEICTRTYNDQNRRVLE